MDPVTSQYVSRGFFNPALNTRENTQGIQIDPRENPFFAETARPPVQCEASLSENSQKHTNIVLHSVIDKGYRLYMFSVLLLLYIHLNFA